MIAGDSNNNQITENGLNEKLEYLYNDSKVSWILTDGTEKYLPQPMDSIMVEVWDAFNVSIWISITDSFVKIYKKTSSPIILDFSTNN